MRRSGVDDGAVRGGPAERRVCRMLVSGQVLSQRYRVEGLLGQGGMGSVYRATHVHLGTVVALKELRVLSPFSAVG